ncbi:MAG: response regulator [Pseudanabaenaceae cyanobacterium SKYGB_i_bin29]|nr:response regulator [Pseudanabaenaceae cyanobacterium SKYG29]MDW8420984.1 response regulator [Pseudanabaenaceae cyanobacterium SKYGB_i_bin29]
MTAHKILVIDDSRVIRNMVRDMLPPENFEVVEAKDGVQGLEMAHKEKPWMIMLDFLLPKMSGYEVYEHIQQNPELSRIPIILMSGRKEEVTSKIPEPFEDKYLVFIEKPFEQRELLLAIKKAMTLAQRRPPVTGMGLTTSPPAVPAAPAVDQNLLDRVAKLEAELAKYANLEEKIRTLEQQLVVQHKQLQQLVNFIKQKMQ